jgi:hypothetical protein
MSGRDECGLCGVAIVEMAGVWKGEFTGQQFDCMPLGSAHHRMHVPLSVMRQATVCRICRQAILPRYKTLWTVAGASSLYFCDAEKTQHHQPDFAPVNEGREALEQWLAL